MAAILRDWEESDAAALLQAARDSPDLEPELGALPETVDAAAGLIGRWLAADLVRSFAVDLEGRACGNIAISHIDPQHGTAWLAYWIAADVRRRGLASRGLAAVADWAFTALGLFRLELGHRVDNLASCRVAARVGFAAEGTQRQKLRVGDERFDIEMHARLLTDPAPAITPLPIASPRRRAAA